MHNWTTVLNEKVMGAFVILLLITLLWSIHATKNEKPVRAIHHETTPQKTIHDQPQLHIRPWNR